MVIIIVFALISTLLSLDLAVTAPLAVPKRLVINCNLISLSAHKVLIGKFLAIGAL